MMFRRHAVEGDLIWHRVGRLWDRPQLSAFLRQVSPVNLQLRWNTDQILDWGYPSTAQYRYPHTEFDFDIVLLSFAGPVIHCTLEPEDSP
jgi:hypothetical protein